ncbi:hypothetical protein [Aurantibacillus circumpalustris]|uniref:hypothetical protein n=1 Tax=Aurantibacillus circumpalustris TaxID=3036359 RepID=UPI00295B5AFF|nr:hypothetical protein [Aurantibacillus circumpalustris]
MKQIIIFFITLLPVCINSQTFDRTKIGSMVPASLVYSDGRTENVNMKMQSPEQLKRLDNILEIEMNENNVLLKEINKSLGTSGTKGTIGRFRASLFDALLIDGNIWAKRPNPKATPEYAQNFVVLKRQGGIQEYTYIEGEYKEGTLVLGTSKGNVVWKWGENLPNHNYKAMIADYPELAQKLEKDLSNLDSVLTAYNVWYEEQFPGRIKYYFQNGPVAEVKRSAADEANDLIAKFQKSKEAKEEREAAKREKMAKRPASPDPTIVSQKPNLPPKKEIFSAKVKRFEQEGHKMAVIIESQKIVVRNSGGGCVEGIKEKSFEDLEYPKFIAAKLNELYQTKIFEVVNIEQIPFVTVKNKIPDDWWTTCYKVVVAIDQTQAYNANLNTMDQKSDVQYFINNRANVTEFIDDEKKSTDYIKRSYNLGDGYSNSKKYEACGTLEKFEEMVDQKIAIERLEKDQAERFAKLVSKWD